MTYNFVIANSFEEAEMMLVDANKQIVAAGDAEDAAKDNEDRMTVVSQVADVLDNVVTEATPTEVALTEAIIRLGQTRKDGDIITVPGMEDYIGKTISTEAVMEVIAKIWEGIKKAVKLVYAAGQRALDHIFGVIPFIRRKIKAWYADRNRNEVATNVMIRVSDDPGVSRLFSVGGTAIDTTYGMMREYEKLISVSDVLLNKYSEVVTDAADRTVGAIRRYVNSPADATDPAMDEIINSIMSLNSPVLANVMSNTNSHDNVDLHTTDVMLGSFVITVQVHEMMKGRAQAWGAVDKAELLTSTMSGFRFVQNNIDSPNVPDTVKITNMTEVNEIMNYMFEITNVMEEFRGRHRRRLRAIESDIISACDVLRNRPRDPETLAVLRLHTAYGHWANNPFLYLNQHLTSVLTNSAKFCDKAWGTAGQQGAN